MTENYIKTIPIVGILIIACSFKIWKAVFFKFRPKSSKGLDNILLKAGEGVTEIKTRCYSSNFVTLKSRPSKTTKPPMNFPDLNTVNQWTQDGNVSEAPDFTCRRLSIKFFDDASDRKYKVFPVVMVKVDFIYSWSSAAELRRFLPPYLQRGTDF